MEKERLFGNAPSMNWQSPPPEMSCAADQLPPVFLNLNWDQALDQSAQFESALSSLVSSPSSNTVPPPPAESVVIRELIGRLGSICNSGEISPPSQYNSTNNSCYSTPLNSPPKLNLSMMDLHHQQQARGGLPISVNPMPASHLAPFATDPGFAERAARFSCFGGRNYGGSPGQFGLPEAGKLSRVSSSQSLKGAVTQLGAMESGKEISMQEGAQLGGRVSGPPTPMDAEFKNAREESSPSDPITGPGESNPRKRKAAPKGKGKETPSSSLSAKDAPKVAEEDTNTKRSKSSEANGADKDVGVKPKSEKNGDGDQKQGKENNAKPPEPPKDYIHVRARRGQATDSHSLAERVRREKISERMKFLQDLVPGCNKVTGKAVMLDEIINYVQSLQRQVEFLSMKLATVNPRLEFNVENFLQKDLQQGRAPLPNSVYPIEPSTTAFSYAYQTQQGTPLQSGVTTNGLETQCSMNPLDSSLRRSLSMQLTGHDGFADAASQIGSFWEDDLQSVVQMGFGQNQEAGFSSQSFHGMLHSNAMRNLDFGLDSDGSREVTM